MTGILSAVFRSKVKKYHVLVSVSSHSIGVGLHDAASGELLLSIREHISASIVREPDRLLAATIVNVLLGHSSIIEETVTENHGRVAMLYVTFGAPYSHSFTYNTTHEPREPFRLTNEVIEKIATSAKPALVSAVETQTSVANKIVLANYCVRSITANGYAIHEYNAQLVSKIELGIEVVFLQSTLRTIAIETLSKLYPNSGIQFYSESQILKQFVRSNFELEHANVIIFSGYATELITTVDQTTGARTEHVSQGLLHILTAVADQSQYTLEQLLYSADVYFEQKPELFQDSIKELASELKSALHVKLREHASLGYVIMAAAGADQLASAIVIELFTQLGEKPPFTKSLLNLTQDQDTHLACLAHFVHTNTKPYIFV